MYGVSEDWDRIFTLWAFRRLKDKTRYFFSAPGGRTTESSYPYPRGLPDANCQGAAPERRSGGGDRPWTRSGAYTVWTCGERALDQVHPGWLCPLRQSVRVVEVLERDGRGLNLTPGRYRTGSKITEPAVLRPPWKDR